MKRKWVTEVVCNDCGVRKEIDTSAYNILTRKGKVYRCASCAGKIRAEESKVSVTCSVCGITKNIQRSFVTKLKKQNKQYNCERCGYTLYNNSNKSQRKFYCCGCNRVCVADRRVYHKRIKHDGLCNDCYDVSEIKKKKMDEGRAKQADAARKWASEHMDLLSRNGKKGSMVISGNYKLQQACVNASKDRNSLILVMCFCKCLLQYRIDKFKKFVVDKNVLRKADGWRPFSCYTKKYIGSMYSNPEYRANLSKGIRKAICNNPSYSQLKREQRHRQMMESGQFASFNKDACKFIDEYGKKNGYNFQHAMNGGEVTVNGYWLDGYDKDKNVVFEYHEPRHEYSKQMESDSRKEFAIFSVLKPLLYIVYHEKTKTFDYLRYPRKQYSFDVGKLIIDIPSGRSSSFIRKPRCIDWNEDRRMRASIASRSRWEGYSEEKKNFIRNCGRNSNNASAVNN